MASTADGRALTDAHRRGQIAIGAQADIELRLLWPMLDARRLDRSEAKWLAASLLAVRPHHEESARLAAAYLAEYRKAEGAAAAPIVRSAWDRQMVAEDLHLAGPVRVKLLTKAGMAPEAAAAAAVTKLAGIGSRAVLMGGRKTIHETAQRDTRATGWRRVTDGDPCTFCAMLASRGPIYASRDTLHGSVKRVSRGGGEGLHYHGHCGCTGELVYGEWEPTDIEQVYVEEYAKAAQEATDLGLPRTQENVLHRMRGNGMFKDSPSRRNITSGL